MNTWKMLLVAGGALAAVVVTVVAGTSVSTVGTTPVATAQTVATTEPSCAAWAGARWAFPPHEDSVDVVRLSARPALGRPPHA